MALVRMIEKIKIGRNQKNEKVETEKVRGKNSHKIILENQNEHE
jgi:hypothetical protein